MILRICDGPINSLFQEIGFVKFTMNKTPQQSQLKSTSSTRASQPGTPVKFEHSPHLASTLFMGKRFVRKRESSTESLKRSELATPKSNNSSMTLKSSKESQNNEQKQLRLSKLANANTFMRGFKSPSFLKISGSFRLGNNQQQHNNQSSETEECINKISVLQNTNESHKITRSNKNTQKSYQHFRVLSSGRNFSNCNNNKDGTSQGQNYVENYSCPQTERQPTRRNEPDVHSEIKVLESELLILQDQNTRLKRQIGYITMERDLQKKQRLQIQRKLQSYDKKLKLQNRKTSEICCAIGKQMLEIRQQLNNKLTINCAFNEKLNDSLNTSSKSWQSFDLTFNEYNETGESSLAYFMDQFWNPIHDNMIDSIDRSARVMADLMNSLSKLQIKQNIIMRNQFELTGAKNDLKTVNSKLTLQKERADRYKQMNNKLKKQINELKNKKETRSFKISSDSALGYDNQSKQWGKDQDALSLILSDDDDNYFPKSNKINKFGSF